MEVRLVKDELNKCYRGEGVNAQQYCKDLAERYVSMLKENRVSCGGGLESHYGRAAPCDNCAICVRSADTQIRGFVTVDREQKI